jgi:hypothetical protein
MTKTLDAANMLACPQVKDFNCLFIFGGKKEPVAFQVESKMIEIPRLTRHRRCRNQFERQLFLRSGPYGENCQCR